MTVESPTEEQIIHALEELPPESLREVQRFLDSLRLKDQPQPGLPPAALGGLLEPYRFAEADIAQARREMWGCVDRSVE